MQPRIAYYCLQTTDQLTYIYQVCISTHKVDGVKCKFRLKPLEPSLEKGFFLEPHSPTYSSTLI